MYLAHILVLLWSDFESDVFGPTLKNVSYWNSHKEDEVTNIRSDAQSKYKLGVCIL